MAVICLYDCYIYMYAYAYVHVHVHVRVVVVVVVLVFFVVVVVAVICYTNLPVTRAFRSCSEGSGHEKLGFTLVFAKELSSKAPVN